jgi:hypothetical protein
MSFRFLAAAGAKVLLLMDMGCTLEEQWTNGQDHTTIVMRSVRSQEIGG